MTGRFWLEMAIGVLALTGLWVTLDKAAAGIRWGWGWWRRDRITPLLEDESGRPLRWPASSRIGESRETFWRRVSSDDNDDREPLEDLPPERTREELGFTAPPARIGEDMSWWTPQRERRAPWWEAEHRAAYESLGFDYPSGMMARVRELTP